MWTLSNDLSKSDNRAACDVSRNKSWILDLRYKQSHEDGSDDQDLNYYIGRMRLNAGNLSEHSMTGTRSLYYPAKSHPFAPVGEIEDSSSRYATPLKNPHFEQLVTSLVHW